MEQKSLLRVVVILLGLSYVLFAAAVPATRSLTSRKVDASVQDLLAKQEDLELKSIEEMSEFDQMQESVVEGRMMMVDTADYPPTGANRAHQPRSPGKA
ncbi:hypothetical protein L6164_009222 [Bauhinia variegata]|uniref:Uncharacterized protein n=1 Tax=Bauhinia variegata TaxID=167791 RepID=A0ACB9PI87_BAUVA|nr:hypothetical protein L6164_009222 [Bauhinia variegata]